MSWKNYKKQSIRVLKRCQILKSLRLQIKNKDYLTNGIQKVSGSIPLSSTQKRSIQMNFKGCDYLRRVKWVLLGATVNKKGAKRVSRKSKFVINSIPHFIKINTNIKPHCGFQFLVPHKFL